MCGICGYIQLDKSKSAKEGILKSMADTLSRRGPDDEGYFISRNIGLGHRRLSIIDIKGGHQPMFNEDGTIAIVFNGEIYNFKEIKEELLSKGHRFLTHSDTEVIIHAYEEFGDDCVSRFNGMFAFALYDSSRERLFLARDKFGKKPLYYALFDNQFIFGSELKAVLKHPAVSKEIDLSAVSKYLAYEYVPAPYSIFKKIYKLPAASRLVLENGGYKIERYWELKFEHPSGFSVNRAKSELLRLLKESVRRRLISDVPLGVFLSGGIDSSAVVYMMSELMSPKEIKTFSIGFRDDYYDESADARRIADHFGTDHREEILSPSVMLDVLPDVLNILDEPFADSSIIPTYLVSKFTRRHVTVALGGDGGDELFMGYSSFKAHRLNQLINAIPALLTNIPLKALKSAASSSRSYRSAAFMAMRFLRGLRYPEEVRHQVWTGSYTPADCEMLFLDGTSRPSLKDRDIYDRTVEIFRRGADLSPMDRAIYIYVNTYLTDDILAKVDRASMANSLEVRAPFLDPEFAEFAASIPAKYKLRNFNTKWILKEALRDKLPNETLFKPKHGFCVPVEKWLKDDLKGLMMDAFSKKKIEREGIFDYSYIKSMVDQYVADKNDTRKEFWALFMFEMWYDKWMN